MKKICTKRIHFAPFLLLTLSSCYNFDWDPDPTNHQIMGYRPIYQQPIEFRQFAVQISRNRKTLVKFMFTEITSS
ncbi:MAG: hypothetical protein HC880_20135 [Bacteroidia bacterium]|nr:hypothetical protein [Bacteroidia bacterium]